VSEKRALRRTFGQKKGSNRKVEKSA